MKGEWGEKRGGGVDWDGARLTPTLPPTNDLSATAVLPLLWPRGKGVGK